MDLISVVVPVYNVRQYLEKCINSILSQTYENFELILVNDGSTDGSDIICEEYKNKDSRIIVLNKENGGLSSARNAGIDICKGKYVCFVDSDDFVTNTYLEYLYGMIVEHNSQMAICSAYWWVDENSYELCQYETSICLNREDTYKLIFSKEKWFGVFAWNKMYMTELFKGVRYPEGYYFEDSGTTYKLIHKCDLISVGYEPHYYYRQQREGQITAVYNRKKIEDKLKFVHEMKQFFSQEYPSIMNEYISYYYNCLLTMYGNVLQARHYNKEDIKLIELYIENLENDGSKTVKLSSKVKLKLMFYKMGKKSYLLYLWLNTKRRKINYVKRK